MSRISTISGLSKNIPALAIIAVVPAVLICIMGGILGSLALAAQDKYTVKVPNGLAFSDFRGYENWHDVAVSQTETLVKAILANDVMINAYRQGVPGNGKLFQMAPRL
ncbi:MAG TPA: hypothetical protein VE396_05065 [Xanthobacteraceae bacterium]|jgi:hypothetical protein|nr:hypothetical protein [Xanthobacteraceae bacterium]